MSSSTKTSSTISSSGSSSSASTNQIQSAGQTSAPTGLPGLYSHISNSPGCQSPSLTSNNGPGTPTQTTSQLGMSNSNVSYTPNTATNNTNTSILHEERVYKKEKQILVEFDAKTKDLKSQLNEGTKCLEQRLDTQIAILYELQDFFKKRAEVELQYSRDLDKLTKSVLSKHKSEKSKRESWHLHSTFKLWESLLNDTKQHSKYHQVASDICSKYVAEKFDVIVEDIKRIFSKCKNVSQASHEEIFKVVGELNGAMKTYHEYQSESKQAEAKLKYVQSQKPKFEKQRSKKKLKQFEKQVEKRLQKYTETKVKAFKARNEYILSIDSANACINKFCTEDIGDIVDCSDFGYHASVARCIYMYLSAQDNIKRSRQMSVDNLSRSIGDLDSTTDKQKFLEYFQYVFDIQKKFQFEAHKGDEVSQVNAQSLIRYEMEKRFDQLDNRLKTLKTENNEIFKTIEATEESLLNFFDVKNNCDMSDLFRDLNLTNMNSANSKDKRIEIEDYYVEKVRQYTTSSNLIARLEARHSMMQKALCGRVINSDMFDKMSTRSAKDELASQKKKIGKSPIIGQPRLFGGKLTEYINVTKHEIPPIITSCIKAINRLGLHNQGIFRIPGSQLEINQFKEAFEKGEDPLITVNPREMNSVAGVLKLYLRELKDPLFPREMYDRFVNSMRINHGQQQVPPTSVVVSEGSSSPESASSPSCLHVENLEAHKVGNIRKVMETVPKPVYNVLRYLFAFLNHLSEFKDENMMDAYNIAICLAPTLIPVPEDKRDQVNHQTDTIELIKIIIQNNDEIFSMNCEGPLYEKFDSEIDEDDVDEVTDEEEEEESERQQIDSFMPNLSDDEPQFYATEAIALYDYRGRSDKELSFKKGDWLSIRGQLSADWWQGCLINQDNNQQQQQHENPDRYIPDKYIALRSSKQKYSTQNSLVQSINTPSSIGLATDRMTTSMNQKSLMSTPTGSLVNNKAFSKSTTGSANQIFFRDALFSSSHLLGNDSESISELLQGKESEILQDEDCESIVSEAISMILNNNTNSQLNYQNQVKYQQMRSSPSNNSNTSGSFTIANLKNSSEFRRRVSLKKQRNLSGNSLITDQGLTQTNKTSSPRSINQQLINFDNLLNNKQQLKMHHIEDALASVLDDMKQLDFTTSSTNHSSANTPSQQNQQQSISSPLTNNPVIVKPNSSLNNKLITNLVSSMSSTKTPSTSSSSSTNSSTSSSTDKNASSRINDLVRSDFSENLSQSSEDELKILKQRNESSLSQLNNKTSMKTILIKRPDLVLDLPVNTNQSPQQQPIINSTSNYIQNNFKQTRRASDNIGLNSSSTSSTESSSISSMASNSNIDKRNQFNQRSVSAAANIMVNSFLLTSATAAVEEALSNSTQSNKPNLETKSVVEVSEKESTTPDVFTDLHGAFDNKKFCSKLEEFKNSNYCSLDDFNIQTLQSENAIEYVELNNEDNPDQVVTRTLSPSPPPPPPIPPSEEGMVLKKQPPPVMKKPDKSEEIMRKLGRSGFDTVSSTSSSSTTTSSVAQESGKSSSGNDGNAAGIIRLSSSKATDV